MGMPLSYNEMYTDTGNIRSAYALYKKWLDNTTSEQLHQRHKQADLLFRRMGVTFAVYGDNMGVERLIPFDIIPRILTAADWNLLSAGLIQRVQALNTFIRDIYHEQEILKAGLIPADLVHHNRLFRAEMANFEPPGGIYINIAGIDVVRTGAHQFHVLEDNLRTPSGVSYMLENREIMMRICPELFNIYPVAPINHYPHELLKNLRSVAPRNVDDPTVVVLTPGSFNSAYFEHAFLADEMGVELVQGQDLFVDNGDVYMRTVEGPRQVDVIYRRVDDDFLDPTVFRQDSLIGVPGLYMAYKNGRVMLANAIGTGIADDKAIYNYVPEMIRFYLGESSILANVPTYKLREKTDLTYVLDHLDELVIKEVHGSGGYGMLVGPAATVTERLSYKERIINNPANFIAQPTLSLSACPTFVENGVAPRHVDLRPFVLMGSTVTVVPGGLTRVALREGSLVVNSSQGGGTKDTWVLENRAC